MSPNTAVSRAHRDGLLGESTLAPLGALLGIAGAPYLVLGATYYEDIGHLGRIQVLPLAVMVVGIPLMAAAAGWLLAGRQPSTITRPPIDDRH